MESQKSNKRDITFVKNSISNKLSRFWDNMKGMGTWPLSPAESVTTVNLFWGHTGPDVLVQKIHVLTILTAIFTHYFCIT